MHVGLRTACRYVQRCTTRDNFAARPGAARWRRPDCAASRPALVLSLVHVRNAHGVDGMNWTAAKYGQQEGFAQNQPNNRAFPRSMPFGTWKALLANVQAALQTGVQMAQHHCQPGQTCPLLAGATLC